MPIYRAPVDDVMFLLGDVFHIDRYNNLPGFAEATPDRFIMIWFSRYCHDLCYDLLHVPGRLRG